MGLALPQPPTGRKPSPERLFMALHENPKQRVELRLRIAGDKWRSSRPAVEETEMAVLLKRLLAFARDSRGVVGIMFGLTLVPMLGMIGLAVDYSVAVRVNSSLRAAADAAALAAARAYVDEAPDNPTASLINAAIERAKQRGANLFNSNVGPSAISPSVSIDLSVNGLKVTSTATYSGASPIYFNKIFGF